MAGFEFFERDLRLATASLEPAQINAALAKFARAELGKAIAQGASPQYERIVNGRSGAAEETVQAPGPIVYLFSNWPLVIESALQELRKRVRSKSGRYAGSFIVIVNGAVMSDYRSIPADAEVIIVNYQPYTRRLDSGRTGARRHFLNAYWALRRRFGEAFAFKNVYLNIGAGVHPMIPYILKGSAPLKAAAQNDRSSAFRAGRATLARRKGTEAGQPISYPAIVINAL